MTPNNLPPLPECAESLRGLAGVIRKHGICTPMALEVVAANIDKHAAEALRQSQSLPAGAVAGLVQTWRTNSDICSQLGYLERAVELSRCADQLEQALQADAREKGEAVAWRVEWSADDEGEPGFVNLDRERGARGRAEEAISEGFQGVVVRPLVYATQPAQASEADSWDRILRSSVPDRWKGCTSPVGAAQSYIAELEQAVMRLSGATDPDDILIAIATSSQETASE